MATWSLVSTAAITVAASGKPNIIWSLTSSAAIVTVGSAWPYALVVSGSPMENIPWFDVPAGWPKPVLPGP